MLVVQFLTPVLDREGEPYSRDVQKNLQGELEEQFGGWSLVADKPLPGAWRNPGSGEIEYDESWRYEVGTPRQRLEALDSFLSELAYRLGQKAIWRVVYTDGEGKAIEAREPE